MTPNIRLRAALCLALSLADVLRARADEPAKPPAALQTPDDGDQNPCARFADTVAAWQAAMQRVKVAKRELDRLEADPVMVSQGTCSDAAWSVGRCRDNYFNRDRALERARDRLDDAQTRVMQVEESARVAGVPQRCLVE
ncbi:MAG TPA: hypothetical protein VMR86_21000 [Myxococcota bacterium]|nr:hypothetical protein [Myxococcota bacterium]